MRIANIICGLLATLAVTSGPAIAETQQEVINRYNTRLSELNYELSPLQDSRSIYRECGKRIETLQDEFYGGILFLQHLECRLDVNGNLRIQEPTM
jgi:hypothetical protein